MFNNPHAKYGEDMRKRAADLFRSGWGYGPVAHELGINAGTVREGLFVYRAVGLEGLLLMGSKHSIYTFEQRCDAVKAVVDRGMAFTDAMSTYGIASRTSFRKRVAAYRKGGAEALSPKPKGRPKESASKPQSPKTREQELEERIRKLEAENAYLKNWRP